MAKVITEAITEANDAADVPVDATLAELMPLTLMKGVKGFASKPSVVMPGTHKIVMFGSVFTVTDSYDDEEEEPYSTDELSRMDIPSLRNNSFKDWFNNLTTDQFDQIWNVKRLRNKIESRLRAPGGLHEWLLFSRANVFKRWGITFEQIQDLRTVIDETKFLNPRGYHDGPGSTSAHNELLEIIDNSLMYDDFVKKLNNWAHYRLDGGREALP